jgi:Small subunit of serine palmitoyltransferase-like
MATGFPGLEPFPLFIDSAPPDAENYFSNMASFQAISAMALPLPRRSRVSIPTKLSNHFFLRYYQYEVTFGLYMLTSTEKKVLNTIVVAIFGAMLYALYIGLQPFVARMFYQLLYYIMGSFSRGGEISSIST